MQKNQVVVNCHYTALPPRGTLAVDYPVGMIDLNVQSKGFSDEKHNLSVRFFAINRGFGITGSQNGHPLSEGTLQGFAHRLINLISGVEAGISWDSHDFLNARKRNVSFHRQPSRTTSPSAPTFQTYAFVLSQEIGAQAMPV